MMNNCVQQKPIGMNPLFNVQSIFKAYLDEASKFEGKLNAEYQKELEKVDSDTSIGVELPQEAIGRLNVMCEKDRVRAQIEMTEPYFEAMQRLFTNPDFILLGQILEEYKPNLPIGNYDDIVKQLGNRELFKQEYFTIPQNIIASYNSLTEQLKRLEGIN